MTERKNNPVQAPFLVFSTKCHLWGEEALKLALAADKAAAETGITLYFAVQAADLRLIKAHTQHIIVTAQHMDPLPVGRGCGWQLPEALKAAGADAVFLNHAEHPMTLTDLGKAIARAKALQMHTIVCADSVTEALAIAAFHPDILLCEPTDLIGTCQAADDSYIERCVEVLRKEAPDAMIMIASGITTGQDVYNVIIHGADGTGTTTGVVKAPDPGLRLLEMARALAKAQQDLSK